MELAQALWWWHMTDRPTSQSARMDWNPTYVHARTRLPATMLPRPWKGGTSYDWPRRWKTCGAHEKPNLATGLAYIRMGDAIEDHAGDGGSRNVPACLRDARERPRASQAHGQGTEQGLHCHCLPNATCRASSSPLSSSSPIRFESQR